MLVRLGFIIVCIGISLSSFSQGGPVLVPRGESPQSQITIDAFFGISLMTTYSGFIRYGFIQISSTGETQITYLSQSDFMQQVTGQQRSRANPEGVNFLEQKLIMWQSFENLWKLRYAEYPYEGSTEKGWAGRDFAPSVAQWNFLKQNYGLSSFSQFIYGDAMWRLVKDSQDPQWQRQYSSLR